MKKASKKTKTLVKAPSLVTLNLKCKAKEAAELKSVAVKYTGGNFSKLVRLAVKSYRPSKTVNARQ